MIKEAISLGIHISTSQIVGFPWETEKDLIATLKQHSYLLDLGVSSDVLGLLPLPGAEGFPGNPIVTDIRLIKDSLTSLCQDEYSKELIRKYPRQFIQLGYYDTPHLRRSFVNAIVETAQQIIGMKTELMRNIQSAN